MKVEKRERERERREKLFIINGKEGERERKCDDSKLQSYKERGRERERA